MATDWTINSDIYDIMQSIKNVQKRYIEDEDETTLSLGVFGFIADTEAKKIQTSTILTGQLGNEMFATRAKLTKNVLAIVPDKDYGEIYTTDKAGNQINPYFSASIKGATITLKQISQTAIPSSVKEGKIHFTVKDCFGNTMPVVLPFTITVKGVAAKKH